VFNLAIGHGSRTGGSDVTNEKNPLPREPLGVGFGENVLDHYNPGVVFQLHRKRFRVKENEAGGWE
jgi:hypothetical protein